MQVINSPKLSWLVETIQPIAYSILKIFDVGAENRYACRKFLKYRPVESLQDFFVEPFNSNSFDFAGKTLRSSGLN